MTDLQILKDCFIKIKCNFITSPSLIGTTIIVPVNEGKEIHYEFDLEGNFLRVI